MNEELQIQSDTYKTAVELHCQVMISKEQVEIALCNFAMHLKSMRDGKHYLELNYESFDDYVQNAVNINIRQVYSYISAYEKLGSEVLQSNARIGITKLSLLATIPDVERADFIDSNDLEGMSVKEIKALIEQSKQQTEQISLLNITIENQKAEIEQVSIEDSIQENLQSKLDAIEDEKAKLLLELDEIKARPIEVAVVEVTDAEIEKIRIEETKKIKSEYDKARKQELKEASDKATKKAEQATQHKIDEAKAQATAQATEQFNQSISTMSDEKAELAKKVEQLAKDLSVAADGDMTTIQFYLDEFSTIFSKITQKIIDIKKKDEKKATGLCGATGRILDVLKKQIGEV